MPFFKFFCGPFISLLVKALPVIFKSKTTFNELIVWKIYNNTSHNHVIVWILKIIINVPKDDNNGNNNVQWKVSTVKRDICDKYPQFLFFIFCIYLHILLKYIGIWWTLKRKIIIKISFFFFF